MELNELLQICLTISQTAYNQELERYKVIGGDLIICLNG